MPNNSKCSGRDLAVPIAQHEDGSVLIVRHKPDHTIRTERFIQAKDGQAVYGDLIKFKPSPDCPGSLEVETLFNSSGPVQVATDSYRDGWDKTFGKDRLDVN